MYKAELNGKEIVVQERSDWKTCIENDFKAGDYFSSDIAWDLINSVPPLVFLHGYFQCGEPHDHRPDSAGKLKPTFLTLIKVSDEPEIWHFKGFCFAGMDKEL